MKFRLPLILLGLVIFSTAALSLLAARSLRRDESIAQQQLTRRAASAVDAVCSRIQARFQSELDQVANAMADAVAAGGDLQLVHKMAARLESSRPLVRGVYLFMSPWGFVWPEAPPQSAEEGQERQELLAVLRSRIASPTHTGDGSIPIALGDRAYYFGPLEGHRGFFVGYELALGAFAEEVRAVMQESQGGGLALTAEGGVVPVGMASATDAGTVVMRNSLGQREVMSNPSDLQAPPLASHLLPAPLSPIRILAYAEDPEAVRRTVTVRTQLYRWGIVMLALGIVGGAARLVYGAREEVLQARAGSDFAIGVSHDLRTPIASMQVLAESLYLGHVSDPARQREFLRTILEEAERLNQLTERVLFLFRFGQDTVHYQLRPADLESAVRAAVKAFMSRYVALSDDDGLERDSDARPDVRLLIAAGLPPVQLDQVAFGQVLLNLLDNAAKYGRSAPAAGATLNVEIGVQRCRCRRRLGWPMRDWVSVTVRDYGRGIPVERRRKIFRRYYREPESRDLHVSGLGLGLSVCQGAMHRHGGWIEVGSPAGGGSAFTCYLPMVTTKVAEAENNRR